MSSISSGRIQLTGELVYSPKLLGDRISSKWWLTVKSDTGLAKYWRHLYHLNANRCYKLQRPSWGEHITIVRNEEPPNKKFWEKYAGINIPFYLTPEIYSNGEYFWMPATCAFGNMIRKELGLGKPFYDFHFSIGHIPEDDNVQSNSLHRQLQAMPPPNVS